LGKCQKTSGGIFWLTLYVYDHGTNFNTQFGAVRGMLFLVTKIGLTHQFENWSLHDLVCYMDLGSNINVIYTSLKSTFIAQQFCRWQCGSIFIRLAVVAFQTCQLAQNSEKIWTYISSRSSKVDDFGTNRKRLCDFLFVINSNFGPILHRFWDTVTYWLQIAYFSYPSLIRRLRSLRSLWNFALKLSVRKLDHGATATLWWRLRDPNFNRLWLIYPYDGRTDGQTDGP